MKSILRIRFKSMFRSTDYQIAMLIAVCVSILGFLLSIAEYYGKPIQLVAPANQQFIEFAFRSSFRHLKFALKYFIFPLVSGLVVSHAHYKNVHAGMLEKLLLRTSRFNYFFSGSIVSFCGGFLVTALPLLLNLALVSIFAPTTSLINMDNHPSFSHFLAYDFLFLKELFAISPVLYNLFYINISAWLMGSFSLMTYCFSLYFPQNRFIVISVPFIFVLLQSMMFSLFQKNNWILVEGMDASAQFGQSPLFTAIAILCLISVSLIAIWWRVYRIKDELWS